MSEGQTLAPGADRIEAIARATIAKLPPAFARHLGDVVLKIEEFADDATLDEMGIENPFELTGLYTGLPIGAKSVDHSGTTAVASISTLASGSTRRTTSTNAIAG